MPKKKNYVKAVVFPIQPLDAHYCGTCEWLEMGETGSCHLFNEDLNSETASEECEHCGAEKLTYEWYCRCPDCIEGECLVRDE